MTITAKAILKQVKCPLLDLVRVTGQEGGYWYFVYDNVPAAVYETESVYCMRLNDMPVDRWVEIGKDFVEKCQAREQEVAEERAGKPTYRRMTMIYKNMENDE